mgnify:CR=1 FL=1
MPQTIGVCAIQGDFEMHLRALDKLGDVVGVEVRTPEELERVDRLILPGGESTSVGLLMQRFGMGDAIRKRALDGMPIWGTCMGMILLAAQISDRPSQWTLGLLDVEVRRNAFGPQVHSFETELTMQGLDRPICAVFIRAPVLEKLGPGVEALAEYDGKVVAVRQGTLLGTSFHPELTDDVAVHAYFAQL